MKPRDMTRSFSPEGKPPPTLLSQLRHQPPQNVKHVEAQYTQLQNDSFAIFKKSLRTKPTRRWVNKKN